MKKSFVPALLLIAAYAAPGTAQTAVNVNGYFSFDAIRGPAGLPSTAWSVTNLWGGLIFSGSLSTGVTFALEPTFAPGESVGLTQAWAGITVSQGIGIKAGLFLVPFGKYNTARRPYETTLISDPDPIGTAYPVNWRELGLKAEATLGNFNAALFAGNGLAEAADFGSGQQFSDNNRNKAWGGRLGVALSTSLEVGGSLYRGKADAANERAITMVGADASWASESIRASGEYVKATIENPGPFDKGTAEGWFGLLEIRRGQWTPAASYQHSRADDPFHGPGFAGADVPGTGISRNGTRWAFGVAYSLATNVLLKLEYDRGREQGADGWTSTIRAQAALHF
ncbi:MAG: porin [Candidatus Aminicenantes bacterium]|nr:porin [Candidatus Aminicenantes bacterium]